MTLQPPPDGKVPGLTGPVGEAALPPSRPSSVVTALSSREGTRTPTGTRSQTSRRGPGSIGSTRAGSMTSRTHVPSITSHAFFKPMSSERLQAQRNRTNLSSSHGSSINDAYSRDDGSQRYTPKPGTRDGVPARLLEEFDERRQQTPPSRGTDYTEKDFPDRGTANTSPTGAETVMSGGGESVTPLHQSDTHLGKDDRLPVSAAGSGAHAAQKSPRGSFRSSFKLRREKNDEPLRNQAPEKLSSEASSPRLQPDEKLKEEVKRNLGRNYEYFTGNTVFWLGGRMQNTRDRPVNIGTGLAVVIPASLYFVFS
jgi:palmitoyltransferase ZDHHC9/14/18